MSEQENKDQLLVKYGQLSLEFSEDKNIYAPFYKFTEEKGKVYLPLELVKFPFFLQSRSEKVLESRKGHKAYKKYEELKRKGASEKELEEATKFTTSTASLRKEYKDWQIVAHQDWGFPDSFDGHVWDVIINLISDTLHKSGNVYLIYTITPNMIEAELIKRGVFKSRSGKTAKRIKDTLHRLKNTNYSYDKGFLRKDTNEIIEKEEYDFRLITNVYERGELLPDENGDEKYATKFAIAIDPLVAINLRHNHYLIVLHKRRGQLKEYESIVLFDKLSYFLYQDIASESVFKSIQMGLNVYRKLSYYNVCKYLGIEPKVGINYKKSQVTEHLKVYHEEIIDKGVIEKVLIQENKDINEKKFNFIYIFKKEFILDMLAPLNKTDKLKDRNYTSEERKLHIAFLQKQINDPEIVRTLFE